jgi:hypothetical protein
VALSAELTGVLDARLLDFEHGGDDLFYAASESDSSHEVDWSLWRQSRERAQQLLRSSSAAGGSIAAVASDEPWVSLLSKEGTDRDYDEPFLVACALEIVLV